MAAVTIYSDLGALQNKVSHCFHGFPIYLHEVMETDAMVLVFWMLSFKPTFWLKKVGNLYHPYSATPANQPEILSNLLQIHLMPCHSHCHLGGWFSLSRLGCDTTMALWHSIKVLYDLVSAYLSHLNLQASLEPVLLTLQNHILSPPQGLALADPTAWTFLTQTLLCWITCFSLGGLSQKPLFHGNLPHLGERLLSGAQRSGLLPPEHWECRSACPPPSAPATACRSPGTWPRAGHAGADTLLNEWINEGNSTVSDYVPRGQCKQKVQRRDQWMVWERLHSFRNLDTLMEGKPSGQTGKDIQWIPISRGLGLMMSLACLGNHEGSCLANLKSSAGVQLKGWAGGLYFSPVQWEAPRWCGLGHQTNVLGRWMWWKPDFEKRLKAD